MRGEGMNWMGEGMKWMGEGMNWVGEGLSRLKFTARCNMTRKMFYF